MQRDSVRSSGPWGKRLAMCSDGITEHCKPGSDARGLGRKKKKE